LMHLPVVMGCEETKISVRDTMSIECENYNRHNLDDKLSYCSVCLTTGVFGVWGRQNNFCILYGVVAYSG